MSQYIYIYIYEAHTLFELGVSRCRTCVGVQHRYRPIIILNCDILSNYYLCRRIGVRVVSDVYVCVRTS